MDEIKSGDNQRSMSLTFEQIVIGMSKSVTRKIEASDLKAWEAATGEQVAAGEGGLGIITAMLSGLVSSYLPGPGTILRSIVVDLKRAIMPDDIIETSVTVKDKETSKHSVMLTGLCKQGNGETMATAVLEVIPPKKSLKIKPRHSLDELIKQCEKYPPISTGVVWPLSKAALIGALESTQLITPYLYGPVKQLQMLAEKLNVDLADCHIEPAETPEQAAFAAAKHAGMGKLQALMKGSLHTNVILHAVLQDEVKLKTKRLLSHCILISAPTYAERIVISDVALNIAPNLDQKRDICQNAIDFAQALGINQPKVAVLSAIETINTKMPSTLDAAVLAKMCDRRQIVGGLVDGPLDLDAAIDINAAKNKHIDSPIAGCANVLIVPNIEAGNLIYKEFAFMADAQIAGLVVGARVPVILTSRADTADQRRFSAAAAVLYAHALANESTIEN
ncbi:MAG: bifunctional enoyl-CoA hydratase/phosphate acetyltransferase [Pseudomonadota bacterium]